MPLILVTNDDGYRSEGIRSLAAALAAVGDVTIVAPLDEASAICHALTLRRPLRLEHVEYRYDLGIPPAAAENRDFRC